MRSRWPCCPDRARGSSVSMSMSRLRSRAGRRAERERPETAESPFVPVPRKGSVCASATWSCSMQERGRSRRGWPSRERAVRWPGPEPAGTSRCRDRWMRGDFREPPMSRSPATLRPARGSCGSMSRSCPMTCWRRVRWSSAWRWSRGVGSGQPVRSQALPGLGRRRPSCRGHCSPSRYPAVSKWRFRTCRWRTWWRPSDARSRRRPARRSSARSACMRKSTWPPGVCMCSRARRGWAPGACWETRSPSGMDRSRGRRPGPRRTTGSSRPPGGGRRTSPPWPVQDCCRKWSSQEDAGSGPQGL